MRCCTAISESQNNERNANRHNTHGNLLATSSYYYYYVGLFFLNKITLPKRAQIAFGNADLYYSHIVEYAHEQNVVSEEMKAVYDSVALRYTHTKDCQLTDIRQDSKWS